MLDKLPDTLILPVFIICYNSEILSDTEPAEISDAFRPVGDSDNCIGLSLMTMRVPCAETCGDFFPDLSSDILVSLAVISAQCVAGYEVDLSPLVYISLKKIAQPQADSLARDFGVTHEIPRDTCHTKHITCPDSQVEQHALSPVLPCPVHCRRG